MLLLSEIVYRLLLNILLDTFFLLNLPGFSSQRNIYSLKRCGPAAPNPLGCPALISEKAFLSVLKKEIAGWFLHTLMQTPRDVLRSHKHMHQFIGLQCYFEAVMLLLPSESVLGRGTWRLTLLQGYLVRQHPTTSCLAAPDRIPAGACTCSQRLSSLIPSNL